MRAMILAAGLGTRLRPLTDHKPKALVEINGRTLLEITLARLRSFGIGDVVINVHHFGDMIVDYLEANGNFGMHIAISREAVLLDTGGGLQKAGRFLLADGADEPFVLHNVDVISSIDLHRMLQFHRDHHALATLAVQRRENSRHLLFDSELRLCGRQSNGDSAAELLRSAASCESLAFTGIHVISPRIFSLLTEDGVFPIVPAYLRLAAQNETILGFPADEYDWRDVGKLEPLRQADEDARRGKLLLPS